MMGGNACYHATGQQDDPVFLGFFQYIYIQNSFFLNHTQYWKRPVIG